MLFHLMHGPFMSCMGGLHGQHGHLMCQNVKSWDRVYTYQALSMAARGLWRVWRRLQLRHVATSPFLRHQSNIALVEYPNACADRSRHGQPVSIHLSSRKSSDTARVPMTWYYTVPIIPRWKDNKSSRMVTIESNRGDGHWGKKEKTKIILGTQSKARAGWPKRLRLVQATPWADFAVITAQLWSTITAIFSWVNNFVFNCYLRLRI